MEFGNPPVIEFTRALGCVGEAARENAVTVAGGGPFPNQTKPNQTDRRPRGRAWGQSPKSAPYVTLLCQRRHFAPK